MSEEARRRGMVILVSMLVAFVCVWLFTVGPWGPWRWQVVARQQVAAMDPAQNLDLSKGPSVSTAPFALHGRDIRVTFTDVSGRSGNMVTFGIRRADADPGSGLGAGIAPGKSLTFTLRGGEPGRYRLFLNSGGATTVRVSESRDRPGFAFLVVAGFVAAIVAWVLVGRRHATLRVGAELDPDEAGP